MKYRRSVASGLLAAFMLACMIGCGGPGLNEVTGTVTLDGDPLPDAMVIFTPMTGGRPAAGKTDAQGKYELVFSRDASGALTGEHVVEISTAEEKTNDDGTVEITPEVVPAKYNLKTELRATIEEGPNTFDFDLDSEGEIIQSESEMYTED